MCVVAVFRHQVEAGGLVRAYSNAASSAWIRPGWQLQVPRPCHRNCGLRPVRKGTAEIGCKAVIHDMAFTEKVSVQFFILPEATQALKSLIEDITAGLGVISVSQGKYLPVRELRDN